MTKLNESPDTDDGVIDLGVDCSDNIRDRGGRNSPESSIPDIMQGRTISSCRNIH